ncbi:terminase large subunit [Pseudomonas phage MR6]|uniref:Putative terminase large subunit n=1 Tax=Pseudomonas phage MR5 TaxID=2711172 RepID=A0A6M3TCS0_9CAUD|nr:putative terminase large subunit [Pseudomonas phage MR5]QJD54877.1 terminase large subunit [Pseudomonas phage MR6]QJD54938.1 putative terminase large subunit [Pseudomonas phage MR7]
MDSRQRWAKAQLVREMYPEFVDFCRDAMLRLGFHMTWMQADMAMFMQHGPAEQMIQAQRGEAKSTVACLYGVWSLTQDPSTRVMLVSGAEDKAKENGILMKRLIQQWDLLDYLIGDKSAGDRTSDLEFDVHWSLRGVEKSASVNCLGLTGSLQGYRADILIPDDIETTKNGLTATGREHIALLSREFSSIVTHGRIMYLGTPQTRESIYNGLPRRGYTVRIWPGRFPSHEEEERYGEYLAPSIVERLGILGEKCRSGKGLDGSRGWSTDPERYTETDLCKKELDQGPEGFQLQFMLDTTLSDAMRQQLKLRDLIIGDFSLDMVPERLSWAADKKLRLEIPQEFPLHKAEMYLPAFISEHYAPIKSVTMTVDPASDGGDELAFAIGGVVGPYVHLLAVGGFKGGFAEDNLEKLVELVIKFNVHGVLVERNMGAGAVTQLIQNYFNGINPDTGQRRVQGCGVDERWASGQKEKRIIDTLRPIIQRHRLVVHKAAMDMDLELLKQYPMDKRATRSFFHQLHSITTDKGSLEKDDRLDAVEALARELVGFLVIDEELEQRKREAAEMQDFLKDPLGSASRKTTQGKQPRSHRAMRRRGM